MKKEDGFGQLIMNRSKKEHHFLFPGFFFFFQLYMCGNVKPSQVESHRVLAANFPHLIVDVDISVFDEIHLFTSSMPVRH